MRPGHVFRLSSRVYASWAGRIFRRVAKPVQYFPTSSAKRVQGSEGFNIDRNEEMSQQTGATGLFPRLINVGVGELLTPPVRLQGGTQDLYYGSVAVAFVPSRTVKVEYENGKRSCT